jgi:hypothetical protein
MRLLNRFFIFAAAVVALLPFALAVLSPVGAQAAVDADALFPTVTVADEEPTAGRADDGETFSSGGILFRSAATVELNEPVSADVVAAAETVVVNAQIAGDLFVAANRVVINDGVSGSLRIAANEVVINRSVGRNALVFGNRIELGPKATIAGDASFFGSQIYQQGTIERSAAFYGDAISIDGTIGGELTAEGSRVAINAGANLKSPAEVTSTNPVDVDPSALGTERITFSDSPRHEDDDDDGDGGMAWAKQFAGPGWVRGLFGWLFVYVALSLVGILVWFFPQWFVRSADTMVKEAGMSWLLGILFLVAIPVVAILLTITLVGLPLAVALWLVYWVGLGIGGMVAGVMIGLHIFPEEKLPNPKQRALAAFLSGFFIISLAWLIPFLGWLLALALIVWGAGAVLVMLASNRAKKPAVAAKVAPTKKSPRRSPAKPRPAKKK